MDFKLLNWTNVRISTYCVCVERITLCNCLCSSSSSHFSAGVIRNIGEFGATKYFTYHQTANKIHGFRDSVPVLKIYDTIIRIRRNLSNLLFLPSDNKVRIVCRCKQPTSNSFQTLQTVYTYSNGTIDQLLYCWKMF